MIGPPIQLNDFAAGAIVEFKWNALSAAGASITRATDGAIHIYKGHSLTPRASSAGIIDSEDFDGLTGLNHVQIDLSDNTDAGFYAAGGEYSVVLAGAVIDGQTVNAVLAHFSIERASAVLVRLGSPAHDSVAGDLSHLEEKIDIVGANGVAVKAKTDSLTFTVAGVVDANITHLVDDELIGNGVAGSDEWRPA